VIESLGLIASVLSVSFTAFLPAVVPRLIALFETDIDHKTRSAAVVTLGQFVGATPFAVAEIPVFEIIVGQPGIVGVCQSISFAAEGLRALGISVTDFLLSLLGQLKAATNADEIAAILLAVGEVICVYDADLPLGTLFQHFQSFFTGISGESHFLPFFFCLSSLIDAIGPAFSSLVGQLFETMRPFLAHESGLVRANCILLIAHTCFVCNIKDDLFQIAVNYSVKEFSASPSREGRRLIGQALKFLVLTNPEELRPRLQFLGTLSRALLESCSYWGLAASLAMSYDFFDEIEAVLELIPPPEDSREVGFCAEFMIHLVTRKIDVSAKLIIQVSVSLFGSSDKHLRSVREETRSFLASQLLEISEAELLRYARMNEALFTRVSAHLRAFTSS
jgi:hypothetical protein